MFRDDYRREMDNLTVSDEFRKETIQLMREKSLKKETGKLSPDNKIHFDGKRRLRAVASVAVLLISTAVGLYATQHYFIGTDQSASDTVPPPRPQQETIIENSKNKPMEQYYDALPRKAKSRVYTIRDAEPVYNAANTTEKILFNTETSDGMGFEGYQLYDISELNTDNFFSEDIVFDSLPLYEFSPMDYEDIRVEFDRILQNTGMTEADINYTEFEWVETVDDGDRKVIDRTISTDTADRPSDTAQLYTVKVDMTGGLVYISHALSEIDLYLYDAVPVTDELAGRYAIENYARLLGENTESYVYDTYSIYGEQHFFPHYVYTITGDYARDVFNNSAGVTLVWNLDDLWMSRNDKGENLHFQYTPEICYTATENLPAISWQQALGLLYNGEYMSSRPEPLTEDIVVEKIELVYKAPPYYPPADYKAGYALPFYKFYVELPEYTWETAAGTLKTYGAYYVCAISPDYVEYADGYLNFN